MSMRLSCKAPVALALGVALLVGGSQTASAKLLELTLKIHGGGFAGLYGTESADPLNTDPDLAAVAGKDFFKERSGAAFGATLGLEVLFVDLIYEFYQFADGDGLSSTLNNLLVGFDWDFRAGEKWLITPYLVAGIGLATQNNAWLKKKYPQIALQDLDSRIVQVRLGINIERKLGRFFRLGLDAGIGYHYAMQTATAANDLDGHSHGFHVMGNIYLAFVWNIFAKKEKPAGPHMDPDPSRTPPADGSPPGQTPAPAPETAPQPVQEPPPAEAPREVAPPERDTPAPR